MASEGSPKISWRPTPTIPNDDSHSIITIKGFTNNFLVGMVLTQTVLTLRTEQF